jgi:hypothetical protein
MKTEYQLLAKITELQHRQKDIEFMLKNKSIDLANDEWKMFVSDIKAEHSLNAERIGYLQSQLKLLKLDGTIH